MKRALLGTMVLLTAASAVSLLSATPQGPNKDIRSICHWSADHYRYNLMELGPAAEQQHMTEHKYDAYPMNRQCPPPPY